MPAARRFMAAEIRAAAASQNAALTSVRFMQTMLSTSADTADSKRRFTRISRAQFFAHFLDEWYRRSRNSAVLSNDLVNVRAFPPPHADVAVQACMPLVRVALIRLFENAFYDPEAEAAAPERPSPALTAEDAQAVLPPLFAHLDADSDGYLTRVQISAFFTTYLTALDAFSPHIVQYSVIARFRQMTAIQQRETPLAKWLGKCEKEAELTRVQVPSASFFFSPPQSIANTLAINSLNSYPQC